MQNDDLRDINRKLDNILSILNAKNDFEQSIQKSFVDVITEIKMLKIQIRDSDRDNINTPLCNKSMLEDFPLNSEEQFHQFMDKLSSPQFKNDIVDYICYKKPSIIL